MMGFLARWARRLSWRDTARAFQTSWEAVYRSVEWFVEWGLAHRQLDGVKAIGVDEIPLGTRPAGGQLLDRHLSD
jgi:transposase